MSDDKRLNLAGFTPAPPREGKPPSAQKGRKVREILFSTVEVEGVWRQVMDEAGDLSNEDFRKAFQAALRTRAMRKLFLFRGEGLELKLATGKNWALERWVAEEAADGSLVVTLKED